MMVTESVDVRITRRNIDNYKMYGYKCVIGETIIVDPNHLMVGSHQIIEVSCKVCEKTTTAVYKNYYKIIKKHGYFSCKGKCSTKKIEDTKLSIYGVTNNSKLDSWKNNIQYIWENRTDLEIKGINDKAKNTSFKNTGFYHHLQSEEGKNKYKDTCLKKYGVTNPSYIKEVREKRVKTKLERFGFINNSQTEEWKISSKETRIENGFQIPDELRNPFNLYRYRVDYLTRQIREELFNNWDGFDFYDGEYIKDNLSLDSHDRNFPNVDHKTSVFYGFKNDIPVEEISNIENLCITKKFINCSKGESNSEDFIKNI